MESVLRTGPKQRATVMMARRAGPRRLRTCVLRESRRHITLNPPATYAATAVALAAALSPCYYGPDPQPGLLLGFGGSREPVLRRSMRVLAEVLRGA